MGITYIILWQERAIRKIPLVDQTDVGGVCRQSDDFGRKVEVHHPSGGNTYGT